MDSAVFELRVEASRGARAVELALLAKDLLGEGFGVISFIAVFNKAFGIPLSTLQRAQAWHAFEWGGLHISDEEFKSLIDPWIDESVAP